MSAPPRPELPSSKEDLQALIDIQVPAISLPDPCRTCEEECEGLEGYGKSFEVDYSSRMIESCRAYNRLVVCSELVWLCTSEVEGVRGTQGKSDWPRAVTEEIDTLPYNLEASYSALKGRPSLQSRLSSTLSNAMTKLQVKSNDAVPGVHPSSRHQNPEERATEITILTGSHWSPSSENSSCLVFPDYKILHNVQNDRSTTDIVAKEGLSREAEAHNSIPNSTVTSYTLPYRAVLLICSHKRRDKRCSIAAPMLIAELKRACEDEGWHVDEHLDEKPSLLSLEELADDTSRHTEYETALRAATQSDTVAIVKVSHIGGHRFAGNVICLFPSGANVWYGRVTPRECEAIVKCTIRDGKVIQELARGGVGLRSETGSILAW